MPFSICSLKGGFGGWGGGGDWVRRSLASFTRPSGPLSPLKSANKHPQTLLTLLSTPQGNILGKQRPFTPLPPFILLHDLPFYYIFFRIPIPHMMRGNICATKTSTTPAHSCSFIGRVSASRHIKEERVDGKRTTTTTAICRLSTHEKGSNYSSDILNQSHPQPTT